MKRLIISTFISSLLCLSLAPAIAAPSDHDLKTTKASPVCTTKFSATAVASNDDLRRRHASGEEAVMWKTKFEIAVLLIGLFVNFGAALSHPVDVLQKTSTHNTETPPGTAGPYNPNPPGTRF
jgi:hypothetical protein